MHRPRRVTRTASCVSILCTNLASSFPSWWHSLGDGERGVGRGNIPATFYSAWQRQRTGPRVRALTSHVMRQLGLTVGQAWVLYWPRLPLGLFRGGERGWCQVGSDTKIGSITWLETGKSNSPKQGGRSGGCRAGSRWL